MVEKRRKTDKKANRKRSGAIFHGKTLPAPVFSAPGTSRELSGSPLGIPGRLPGSPFGRHFRSPGVPGRCSHKLWGALGDPGVPREGSGSDFESILGAPGPSRERFRVNFGIDFRCFSGRSCVRLLLATCFLLLATCYLLLAICCLLLAACHLLLATRVILVSISIVSWVALACAFLLLLATCTCQLLYATCYSLLTTRYSLLATSDLV